MRWINYSESKSYFEIVQSHWPSEKFKVKLGLHAQEIIQVFALLLKDSSHVYLMFILGKLSVQAERSNNKKALLQSIDYFMMTRYLLFHKLST